jgi:beta-glucuronidase
VRGHDILLNGKPIFLRGVAIHAEEFGANPTRNITPEAARALLLQAKTGLHANYVRLAHYPHPETMLRAADELGLLVWSEIPVYWQVDFANPHTLATHFPCSRNRSGATATARRSSSGASATKPR